MSYFSRFTRVCVLFICLLLVVSSRTFADDAQLLRNKFTEGKTAYLIMDTTVESVTTQDEKQFPMTHGMKTVMSYTVTTINKQDIATVKIGIEELKTTGRSATDLKKLMKIEDEKITLKISQTGEVLETSPPPSMPQAPTSFGSATPPKNPWLKLPEQPVEIGATWVDEQTVPTAGASKPIIAHTTYTLKNLTEQNGNQTAELDTFTQIRAKNVKVNPAGENPSGVNMVINYTFKEFSADTKGTMKFNIDLGRIESYHTKSEMLMDLSGETNIDEQVFPSKFVIKSKGESHGRFTDKLPE